MYVFFLWSFTSSHTHTHTHTIHVWLRLVCVSPWSIVWQCAKDRFWSDLEGMEMLQGKGRKNEKLAGVLHRPMMFKYIQLQIHANRYWNIRSFLMLEILWIFFGSKKGIRKNESRNMWRNGVASILLKAGMASGHLCREGHQPQEITTSARLHTDVRQAWVALEPPCWCEQLLLRSFKKFRGFPPFFGKFIYDYINNYILRQKFMITNESCC